VLATLGFAAVVLFTVAAARPQRTTVFESQTEARSLVLALDISRSMATADFGGVFGHRHVSRLDAVKAVVRRFVGERSDERLGLVVFGNAAYVQAPLTRDYSVIEELVARLQVGMAGDGTAMGDGLGLAIKRIADLPARSRAVILVTDGVSNSGQVNPLKAAEVARDLGIKVYTIGIGGLADDTGGQTREYDEPTLREVARITAGTYLNAATVGGLEEVYAEIERLERVDIDVPETRIIEELFAPFLLAALLCYGAYGALARSVFRRIP
jgi:Ca-activated chloride channel family protein